MNFNLIARLQLVTLRWEKEKLNCRRMPNPNYTRPAEGASPERIARWKQTDVSMESGSAKYEWLSQLPHDLCDHLSDRAKRTAPKVALGVSQNLMNH